MRITDASADSEKGFFRLLTGSVKRIFLFRELVTQLFKRDFLGVYKKSFFGLSWIIVSPLLGIVSWVIMNRTGILTPGKLEIPYPVYLLVSTFIWSLFTISCQASSETLRSGAAFISLVDFPHEILLIKQFASHAARIFIVFLLNIGVLLAWGVDFSWKIMFLPLLILPLVLAGAGAGLLVSLFSAVTVDFSRVFNIGINLLMYITPVIFSPTPDNRLLKMIISLNPLTPLINNPRNMMIYGSFSDLSKYLFSSLGALVFFLVCYHLFLKTEKRVIERIF